MLESRFTSTRAHDCRAFPFPGPPQRGPPKENDMTTRLHPTSRTLLGAIGAAAMVFAAKEAAAAPAAPGGAHPRIWLTAPAVSALKANAGNAGSSAAAVVAQCQDVIDNPGNYTSAVYQGQVWAFAASSCGMAYQLTTNPAFATAGATMLTALLNDYSTIGDGLGGDAVVQHDTGYAIRFFAPHAALAYDWLHDTLDPNTQALARERFKAWIDWYTASGYLNNVPGANYHAGYVFSKTLVSIAASGEDDGSAATYWSDVNDNLFANQIVGTGLAPGGVMNGGDWAEGWEYGPLSIVEYALAARAVEEQGGSLPAMHTWASDLTRRFIHGLTPRQDGMYVGGDFDSSQVNVTPSSLTLIATLAGPGSDQSAAWAKHIRAAIPPTNGSDECLVFNALAEARQVPDVDFESTQPPTAYLAAGTRNLYARSDWGPGATWAVFTSAPRLVPDHQHPDAANFVLSRGADALIADPSPYGTQSTLTGNGVAIDSNDVASDARPSQTSWSAADMPWARLASTGVVAARGDYALAFNYDGAPSDVGFAKRDYVYMPEGEVVLIDRVTTGDPSRVAHIRLRTPASLTLSGNVARGTSGGSDVAIQAVSMSGGSPTINTIAGGGDCYSGPSGQCTSARFSVNEYALDLPGPSAQAVHVVDALGNGEAASQVAAMTDPSVDATPSENAGIVGASVLRNGVQSYVVSSAINGAVPAAMTYGVPGATQARHVAFDAPEDGSGNSTVVAAAQGGRCEISIVAGGTSPIAGHPLMFTVSDANSGCAVTDSSRAPAATTALGVPVSGKKAVTNGDQPGGTGAGCACTASGKPAPVGWAGTSLIGLALLAFVTRMRGKRTRAVA